MNAAQSHHRGSTHAARLSAIALAVKVACGTFAYADLPTGGNVVSGTGSIVQSGNTLTVNQRTARMGVEWESFNVGAGQRVQFVQPGADSVALNRVVGSDASRIMGSLDANGKVFLVNPNGVLFGKDAQVNTGGLIASTLDISNEDFAAGNLRFTKGAKAGSVVNAGNLTAGSVVLIAPTIENSGSINTYKGNTTLAAGEAVTVSVMNNGLITATVDKATLNASIKNSGRIVADGGSISLQAGTADAVLDSLINTEGLLQARSIENRDGKIFLGSGAGGTTLVGGTVDASGYTAGQKGGEISALGKNIGVVENAAIDASGANGGGKVLIGGNWQGQGPEMSASAVLMGATARIKADATDKGNGGTAVLWSDDYTLFQGSISARGGANGGNGGNVETSGKQTLQAIGIADASAPKGAAGQWLLDPTDVIIRDSASSFVTTSGTTTQTWTPTAGNGGTSYIQAALLNAALDSGTNVFVTTASADTSAGDITVNAAITKSTGGEATLTLRADRNITVNSPITSTSGRLNVVLNSRASNGSSGYIYLNAGGTPSGSITTNGGYIYGYGGSTLLGGAAISTAANDKGIFVGSTLNAGGGDIVLIGHSATTGSSGILFGNQAYGPGALITSGTGNITLTGTGTRGIYKDFGSITAADGTVTLNGTGTEVGVVLNRTVSTTTGNIVIAGTATGAAGYGLQGLSALNLRSTAGGSISLTGSSNHASGSAGIWLAAGGPMTIQTQGAGSISLIGTGGATSGPDGLGLAAIQVGASGQAGQLSITAGTGGVSITGNGTGAATHSLLVYGTCGGTGSAGSVTINGNRGIDYRRPITAANNITIKSTGLGDYDLGTLTVNTPGGDILVSGMSAVNLRGNINHLGTGDMMFQAGTDLTLLGTLTKSSAGRNRVAFESAGNIDIQGAINSTSGALDVLMRSRSFDAAIGWIDIGADIATLGGDIFMWGGSGSTPGSGVTGAGGGRFGINVGGGRTLDAGGGHIALWGGTTAGSTAIEIGANSTLKTIGTGNIAVRGTSTHGAWGIYVNDGASFNAGGSGTGSGNIVFEGSSTSGTRGVRLGGGSYVAGGNLAATGIAGGAGGTGIALNSDPAISTSFSAGGNITFTGTGESGINFLNTAAVGLASSGGVISLNGNASGSGTAISLGAPMTIFSGTGGVAMTTTHANANGIGITSSATGGSIAGPGPVSITGQGSFEYRRNINGGGIVTVDMTGPVTLANVSSTAAMALRSRNGTITVNGTLNANSAEITARALGNLTLGAAASLSGSEIYLSSDASFINNAGASALDAAARWIIYSNDPTANVYGGLASGNNAIWRQSFGTMAPGAVASGNRYVFRYSPLAGTVEGTATKIYGETVPLYVPVPTLTAYTDTQGGMWIADTIADIDLESGISTTDLTSAGLAFDANVGTYAISGTTYVTATGYALSLDPALQLQVLKRAITVSAQSDTKTYDGTTVSSVTPTITAGSLVAGDSVTWSQVFGDRHAGSGKTLTASGTIDDDNGGNNYDVTFIDDTSGVIERLALTASLIGSASRIYDGTTGIALTHSNYDLDGVLAGDMVDLNDPTLGTLDTKHVGSGKNVSVSGLSLSGADAGNYIVNVSANANIAEVTRRALTIAAVTDIKTYDQTATSSRNVNLTGLAAGDSVTASQSFDSRNAGNRTLSVDAGYVVNDGNGGNNYLVTATDAVGTIDRRNAIVSVLANDKVYDGNTIATGTVSGISGVLAGDTVVSDGTASFSFADKNVGNNKAVSVSGMTLTGADALNYQIASVDASTASITPATLIVTAVPNDKVYGQIDPTLGYSYTGLQGLDDASVFSGALSRAAGDDVGLYAIDQGTLSAGSNYVIGYTDAGFRIAPATLTIGALAGSKVYGNVDPTLGYNVSGLVNGDTSSVITGALARTSGENVGSYNISLGSVSAGGNYTITYTGSTFDITRRTLTVNANDLSKIYGNADPSLTFSHGALANGDTDAIFSGSLTRGASENVGSYAISRGTLSAGNNYDVMFTGGNLSITPRTLTVSANARGRSYGDIDPTLSFSHGALVNGDTDAIFSGSLTRVAGEDVGSYAISQGTLSAGSNYFIDFTGNAFDIATGLLVVNANALAKIYGNADPALTYTFSGLVNGDDASVFTGGLTRAAGENVGNYAIGQGTLSAGSNYTIQFNSADLAVSARDLYVTADAIGKIYGSIDPLLTYGFTGLANGDTASVFTGGLARNAGENVSNFAIAQGSLSAGGNYTLHYTGNTFSITPASLRVTANAASKIYGDLDPTLSYTFSGLVNGDTSAVFTGDLTRAAGEVVLGGPYAIGQGSLSAGANYVIEFTGNQMVITPKALTVDVANNIAKVYDGTTALPSDTGSYNVSGIVGSDDVNVSGSLAFDSRHIGTRSVSLTDMSLSGVDASNYYLPITSTNGSGTIAARAITVTARADSKVYDGNTSSNLGASITHGSLASGDNANWSQSFDNRNAGMGKTLSASGAVDDGNGGNNYLVTFVNDTNGVIERRAITVSAQADSKIYDGTVGSSVAPVISDGTLVNGDSATWRQSFADAVVGTGKTLTANGAIDDGNAGDNYQIAFVDTTDGTIIAADHGGGDGGNGSYDPQIAIVRDSNFTDLRNRDPGNRRSSSAGADLSRSDRTRTASAPGGCSSSSNSGMRMPERPVSFLKNEPERRDAACSFFE